MGNKTELVDVSMLTIGTWYGLENIEQILGIIILVIQLAWLLIKLGCAIYRKIKNKEDLSTLDGNVSEAIGIVGEIIDRIDDMQEEKNDEQKEVNDGQCDKQE